MDAIKDNATDRDKRTQLNHILGAYVIEDRKLLGAMNVVDGLKEIAEKYPDKKQEAIDSLRKYEQSDMLGVYASLAIEEVSALENKVVK